MLIFEIVIDFADGTGIEKARSEFFKTINN